ncbi:hypothetical protein Pcinc_023986 [Petrolisthes cinctipes]|uniref:Uncharacterized protein n=1 Tax=Petrolisthes cinctipes TaxID=88211 RepID=A0AAE1KFY5_PETCI|nr:hypothetical protein Pcinc_023986 [Petrolisthes cinctipes]
MIAEREKPGAAGSDEGWQTVLSSSPTIGTLDLRRNKSLRHQRRTKDGSHCSPSAAGSRKEHYEQSAALPVWNAADKAVQRFNMTIIKDWRPEYKVVRLEALPRMREDAQTGVRRRSFWTPQPSFPAPSNLWIRQKPPIPCTSSVKCRSTRTDHRKDARQKSMGSETRTRLQHPAHSARTASGQAGSASRCQVRCRSENESERCGCSECCGAKSCRRHQDVDGSRCCEREHQTAERRPRSQERSHLHRHRPVPAAEHADQSGERRRTENLRQAPIEFCDGTTLRQPGRSEPLTNPPILRDRYE